MSQDYLFRFNRIRIPRLAAAGMHGWGFIFSQPYSGAEPLSGGLRGGGGADEFNPDVLKDPERSLLVSYLSRNVSVFHCPGDKRLGLYQGKDPTALATTFL
jgi:hypothetical protein